VGIAVLAIGVLLGGLLVALGARRKPVTPGGALEAMAPPPTATYPATASPPPTATYPATASPPPTPHPPAPPFAPPAPPAPPNIGKWPGPPAS
jgi:hypothetical protein